MAWIDWEGFFNNTRILLEWYKLETYPHELCDEPYDYLRDQKLWQLMQVKI